MSTTVQAAAPRSRLRDLGRLVDGRVTGLQERYLAGRNSVASAELALLRRGLGRPPGSLPEIWHLTLADVPRPGHGDAPSAQERAAHAALTLYAVHQQSRRDARMHVPDRSLGAAVRALVRAQGAAGGDAVDAEGAVRRRFDALMSGGSFEEILHHLRGLVSQLRSAGVGLDYGRLADDLEQMQTRRGLDQVRLRWGRDYHARPHSPTDSEENQ